MKKMTKIGVSFLGGAALGYIGTAALLSREVVSKSPLILTAMNIQKKNTLNTTLGARRKTLRNLK